MKSHFIDTTLALLLAAFCLSGARAQDPATPSPSDTLLTQLVDWTIDGSLAAPSFSADAACVSLDGRTSIIPAAMGSRLSGAQLVAAVSFRGDSETLASELSTQMLDVKGIPAEARDALVVAPARAGSANDVARRWVKRQLESTSTDTIHVAVLWSANSGLTMLMVKSSTDSDGVPVIRRIAWGPVGPSRR